MNRVTDDIFFSKVKQVANNIYIDIYIMIGNIPSCASFGVTHQLVSALK